MRLALTLHALRCTIPGQTRLWPNIHILVMLTCELSLDGLPTNQLLIVSACPGEGPPVVLSSQSRADVIYQSF